MALTNGDSQLTFKDFRWESNELGYRNSSYPRYVQLTSEFNSQSFNANYRLSISSDDINDFIRDLEKVYNTLKGRAEIVNLEGNLKCMVSSNIQGQIEVSGHIQTFCPTNKMLFEFVTDQTFLPAFIEELKMEFARLKSS